MSEGTESVADLPATTVERLLVAVGERTTAPGGGAVSGLVAALAGALTRMAALFATGPDAADVAARAGLLGARAAALAEDDLAVYAAYVQSRRSGRSAEELAAALDEATRVPLDLAEVAAQVAALAAVVFGSGNPRLRGDAAAAVLLAAAATRSAVVLACENLAEAGADDPRLVRAADLVAAAGAAERSVAASYAPLAPRDA